MHIARMRAASCWIFGIMLFWATGSLLAVQAPAPTLSPESEKPPAAQSEDSVAVPIELDGRPLVLINANVAGYSPAERAARIRERLLHVARDRAVPVESFRVQDREAWSEIHAGNVVLMWITEADAKAAGKPRAQVAAEIAETFRQAVARYRSVHTWRNFIRGLVYSVIATIVFVALWIVAGRLHRTIRRRVLGWVQANQSETTASLRRIPAVYLGTPLVVALGVARGLFVLALLEIYVTVVLGFFPATRYLSRMITDWLFSQLGALGMRVIDYLPNLLLVIVICLGTYYVVRLNSVIFREIASGRLTVHGFYPDWAEPTAKLIRALILILSAVIVFPYLPGSKSPAFQGISIFVGLLLSLGSSSAVANAVAGTILTYMRSFQVGDWVKVADTTGEVVEKNLLVTRILTPKKEVITIPNGTIMGASVLNYSARKTGVIFHTTITIGYDAPWRKVHQLLIGAADSTAHILKEPGPFVLQTSLDDFYVSYELNAYTDTPCLMAAIYSELHQNIQDKFNEAGVEIMSPHYSQLRDGNQTTIPANYLPADYEPPSFRVEETGGPVQSRECKTGT